MNKNNEFGKKLKQIRKSKGLTQERLAELAGVHEKHISKLEIGCYKPSFNTLNKILSALNVTIQDIDLNLQNVSTNDNPFYIKSIQILNSADEKELEYYYTILKAAKISMEIYLKKD